MVAYESFRNSLIIRKEKTKETNKRVNGEIKIHSTFTANGKRKTQVENFSEMENKQIKTVLNETCG